MANLYNDEDMSLLVIAADSNKHGMVYLILNDVAKIEDNQEKYEYLTKVGKDGINALMLAAQHGNEKAVAAILEAVPENRKADYLKAVDNDGVNALMWAAHGGHENVLRVILEQGESVVRELITQKDNGHEYGFNALLLAADQNHENVVSSILDSVPQDMIEEQLFTRSNLKYTALMLAAERDSEAVVDKLLSKVPQNLIEKYLSEKSGKGDTALMVAISNHREKVVDKILSAVPRNMIEGYLFTTNNMGKTALMLAAEQGEDAMVDSILRTVSSKFQQKMKEGYLGAKSNEGYTALMLAAEEGYEGVVDKILSAVPPNMIQWYLGAKNNKGQNALMLAVAGGHEGVVSKILSTVSSKFQQEMKEGYLGAKSNEGYTALMLAAEQGEGAMVDKILRSSPRGRDVDSKRRAVAAALRTKYDDIAIKILKHEGFTGKMIEQLNPLDRNDKNAIIRRIKIIQANRDLHGKFGESFGRLGLYIGRLRLYIGKLWRDLKYRLKLRRKVTFNQPIEEGADQRIEEGANGLVISAESLFNAAEKGEYISVIEMLQDESKLSKDMFSYKDNGENTLMKLVGGGMHPGSEEEKNQVAAIKALLDSAAKCGDDVIKGMLNDQDKFNQNALRLAFPLGKTPSILRPLVHAYHNQGLLTLGNRVTLLLKGHFKLAFVLFKQKPAEQDVRIEVQNVPRSAKVPGGRGEVPEAEADKGKSNTSGRSHSGNNAGTGLTIEG